MYQRTLKHMARELRGARAQGGHGSGSEPWDADSEGAPDAVAVSQQGSVGALSDAGAGAAAAAATRPDERACRCEVFRPYGVERACRVNSFARVVRARLSSHQGGGSVRAALLSAAALPLGCCKVVLL
jgi:hypothetical protein